MSDRHCLVFARHEILEANCNDDDISADRNAIARLTIHAMSRRRDVKGTIGALLGIEPNASRSIDLYGYLSRNLNPQPHMRVGKIDELTPLRLRSFGWLVRVRDAAAPPADPMLAT